MSLTKRAASRPAATVPRSETLGTNFTIDSDGNGGDTSKSGVEIPILARYRAFGNSHLVGAVVHHPGVLTGAHVASKNIGDPARQIIATRQRRISRQGHFTVLATQPRARDLELGGAQIDQTALAAVPAHLTGRAARVLRSGHRHGGHHQQLFDKLTRCSTQQILDRQLRLPDHRQQR